MKIQAICYEYHDIMMYSQEIFKLLTYKIVKITFRMANKTIFYYKKILINNINKIHSRYDFYKRKTKMII